MTTSFNLVMPPNMKKSANTNQRRSGASTWVPPLEGRCGGTAAVDRARGSDEAFIAAHHAMRRHGAPHPFAFRRPWRKIERIAASPNDGRQKNVPTDREW